MLAKFKTVVDGDVWLLMSHIIGFVDHGSSGEDERYELLCTNDYVFYVDMKTFERLRREWKAYMQKGTVSIHSPWSH